MRRARVRVTGTVQGVGFRPFVYRNAVALGLTGFVRNDAGGVEIEVQGRPDRIEELCRLLGEDPPPLARVEGVIATPIPTVVDAGFSIEASGAGTPDAPVSVDTGVCAECVAELEDPADRRYRYPFINCTNCGPRYTIVLAVPYDRPATTMSAFRMCDACQREYDDPADRRFHAQPNACPACGPALSFGDLCGPAALDAAVAALDAGRIVAIKGIGGFHLAVDATNPSAVTELRRRKARDDKPFAVLVERAAGIIEMDAAAEDLLADIRRPVVLAPRRPGASVADAVAPGLPELGVMLPYSPLHHLLVRGVGRPLVLTSGNVSDDPIAHTDDDARTRLGPLVDGMLTHDRPIHIRCDDSVVRVGAGRIQVLRRSRGYAPEPLRLPFDAARAVLAVGAELKSTICVTKGRYLVASHHIGDLEHLANCQSFLQAIDHIPALYGVTPEVVAHDLHPEYLSTKLALELDLPAVAVQHHHAHVAACLAEHGRTEAVLGVAFDGLGYGPDGTLWGGELLVADLSGYQRVGHLVPVALPGGTTAIREPWRMAVSWVLHALGPTAARTVGARFDERAEAVVALAGSRYAPTTSSVGRLFDAVAAIVTGRARVTYEGQAAIELEALARGAKAEPYPVHVSAGGELVDPSPLIAALLSDDRPAPERAAAFHAGFASATVAAATALARSHGLDTVALTGGVFQNVLLTDLVASGLHAEGLTVLLHEQVPPNDGGISIGQAAIAAYRA